MFDLSSLVPSVSFSIVQYQRHAWLVNMTLLCAIYWHHITGFEDIKVFQNCNLVPPPCKITSCSFNICLEKRLNCSTQTHTDTRMEFTQRNEVVHSCWQQTTTGDGEERERHTDRGIILFSFFFFLYRIPFSPLTLLGLTALCRFSIHLSLSAAERHAKHLVPDAVVTWGYSQW